MNDRIFVFVSVGSVLSGTSPACLQEPLFAARLTTGSNGGEIR